MKLAIERIPALVDLFLVGRAQIAIETTQRVELAVFRQWQLPPGRCLDGLDLHIAPGQGVGGPLVQSPTDRVRQRLVEGNLRPADIAGEEVLAAARRGRDS